jgi:hypothetical protein
VKVAPIAALPVAVVASVALAQSPPVVVTVHDGRGEHLIARRSATGWVAAGQCSPAGDTLTVSAGAVPVDTPRRVLADGAEWRPLEAAILSVFDQRQREHRLTSSNVAGTGPTIDWVYAQSDGGATFYYFEVSRRIPDPGTAPEEDPKGTLRVAISGWLHAGASGGLRPIGSKSELRWEQDGTGPETPRPDLRPLGVIRYREQRIWVMHSQIGTRGRYTLYDVGPETVDRLFDVAAEICA